MMPMRLFPGLVMGLIVSSALARPPRDLLTEPHGQTDQEAAEQTQADQRPEEQAAPVNVPMGRMEGIHCWPDGGLASKLRWVPILGKKLNRENNARDERMTEQFLGLRVDATTGEMYAYFMPERDPPFSTKELSEMNLSYSGARLVKLPPEFATAVQSRSTPDDTGLLRKTRNFFRRETQREDTAIQWKSGTKTDARDPLVETVNLNIKRSQVKSGFLGRKRKEQFSGTVDFSQNGEKARFSLKCEPDVMQPPEMVP